MLLGSGNCGRLAVSPGSPLFVAGDEVIAVAGSIEQGKLLARAADDALPPGHLRWTGLLGGRPSCRGRPYGQSGTSNTGHIRVREASNGPWGPQSHPTGG